MSLRHAPPRGPVLTPPSSPSLAAQKRHQDQLANYRRDPSKASAKDSPRKVSRLQAAWAVGRRLSGVLEEGIPPAPTGDEDETKKRRTIIPFAVRRHLRRSRLVIYVLAMGCIWFFVVRPLSQTVGGDALPGKHSEGLQQQARATGSAGKVNPLSSRRGGTHVKGVIPAAVKMRTAPDHPIEKGLLKVDLQNKVHPIYQLIRDGREAWDTKVARQSKTLKEAVEEYKRRYHRQPPKGFDKWWRYVVENDVPLPDEYDRIHHDLLPFRALSPKHLNKKIQEASLLPDTYTLRVKSGSVRTSSTYDPEQIWGADFRLADQSELLKPIAKYLGDFSAVYSVHDSPMSVVSWDHRAELIEHVEEDEWYDEDTQVDTSLRGWAAACPRNSQMRVNRFAHHTSSHSKGFVASHSTLMDICEHPELVPLHGALSDKHPTMGDLVPIFSLSKTSLHADILGVPTEQWVEDTPSLPWDEKNQTRLLWRGTNTGTLHTQGTAWRNSHRSRLVRLANKADDDESVSLLPPPKSLRGMGLEKGVKEVPWIVTNGHYMDVGFVSEPLQCSVEDGTCDELRDEFTWLERMQPDVEKYYRYILDVDGNAWSARFKRLLTTGSLIFKSTIMPEWWTDRIQPWVHYVPVQVDYSDIYDVLTFFRGDLNDRAGEPALAADIAAAGKEWSATHWRKEDMVAYVFRLYLEWARLVAPSRGKMDFVYRPEMEVGAEGGHAGTEHAHEM